MNLKKILPFIICFLMVFSSFKVVTYATDNEHSTHVQYNVSKDSKYKTLLKVIGPGTVYDGTAKIMQGTMVYELNVEEIKTFSLIPNKNSKIKHVIWNNNDITNKLLKENEVYKLNIQGISDNSTLLIEFINDNNSNNNSHVSNKLPNTGYTASKIAILFIILGVICISIRNLNRNKNR